MPRSRRSFQIQQPHAGLNPPGHPSQFFTKIDAPFSDTYSRNRAQPEIGVLLPDEKSCSVAEKQPFRGRVPIQSSRDTRSGPNAGATFLGCQRDLHSTSSGGMGGPLQSGLARVKTVRKLGSIALQTSPIPLTRPRDPLFSRPNAWNTKRHLKRPSRPRRSCR